MADPLASLFEGTTGRQRDQALYVMEEVTVRYGTPLMVEGDEDPSLLVVMDGELEIRTGDLELATVGPGAILGEIGLFTGGMRTATVESNTEATLRVLTRAGYEELVDRNNPVARRLEEHALDTLVQRLRHVDSRISQLAEGSPMVEVAPSKGFFDRVVSLFGAGGRRSAPDVDSVTALSKARVFHGIPGRQLAGVAPAFRVEAWGPGSFLCTEGEIGDAMYVVVRGLVDVFVATTGDKVEPVATLDPGDAFGMAGLVDNRPRTASCVARDEVIVLTLDRPAWNGLVARDDEAGRALRVSMIRSLAEQLAYANGQLALVDLTRAAADVQPLLLASAGVEARAAGLGG